MNEPLPWYPVLLDVRGRECLVVGGGAIGARKAEGLHACGATVTVVSIGMGEAILQLAESSGIVIHRRAYEVSDLEDKWLVVTAVTDPAVTAAVYADAKRARVWMNAADDPPHCSVILPAVHRDGEVIVAVSTGGASPATAGWLRDRIAKQAGDLPGRLADAVKEVRSRVRIHRTSEGMPWRDLADLLATELTGAGTGHGDTAPDSGTTDDLERRCRAVANAWLRSSCLPAACGSCQTECGALFITG